MTKEQTWHGNIFPGEKQQITWSKLPVPFDMAVINNRHRLRKNNDQLLE